MADIGGLFGAPWDRLAWQIAARPHRFHVIEEERAVTAEEILNVVLRRRERDVNMGLIHQAIEQWLSKGREETAPGSSS